ncbi:SET domain-containing protein-lysine N-methyltransferase [Bradyrhizobium sp. SSUT18]|uniref:SET domain-containing protein-lysine N-methyltransferase n=1 Tax=Bradyrhizobium sp. SSUT18 TaxID=3040602 RepID=UPI00244CF618|nr:SET domain-containing protein-lysine N-methyltransferase [Bradyrhizobium sp. SSUT18]MDH2406961.1 SET domain-containing protein-lysine N-methyltransferase [Bradyrhizobium sp. SSUT18]
MIDKVFDCSNTVYIKTLPRKGRGVFANIPFNVGDVIERAPTWGFDDAAAELLDRTGIFQYYFVRNDRHLQGDSVTGYVVFGFISIVNHSFNPNARIVWADDDSGTWASIVATKDIKIDEEITHRYTNVSAYPDTVIFID